MVTTLHLGSRINILDVQSHAVIDTQNVSPTLMKEAVIQDSFILQPHMFITATIREEININKESTLQEYTNLETLGLKTTLLPDNKPFILKIHNNSPLPIKLYTGMNIATINTEETQQINEQPDKGKSPLEEQEEQLEKEQEQKGLKPWK